MGITFRSLWGTLVALWDHFEVTLRSLLAYEGDVGSVWHHFAITVESLCACKDPLSKNTYFPHIFNDFIKRRRLSGRIEKQISLMIMSIRTRFGCILAPFGVRFGSVLHLSGRIEYKFASDRPQVGPKSDHKQIKNIFPKGFSFVITHFDVVLASL